MKIPVREKIKYVPRNNSATDVKPRIRERRRTRDAWNASHWRRGRTGCQLTPAYELSKNTRSAWEPREAPDASLSSLTPLPVWPNTPFVVKIIRQFLTPLIFSITINNRSSLLNLIIGPSRCYLRTRLSFGLTKKYMNERLKCPSVLLRRAGTPCRTG